jgi:hypothetical protein
MYLFLVVFWRWAVADDAAARTLLATISGSANLIRGSVNLIPVWASLNSRLCGYGNRPATA